MSSEFEAGRLELRCNISQSTANDLINSIIASERRPVYIE